MSSLLFSNSLDYKDDMDSEKFEEFLHELCQELCEKYDKIAIVMDNASYHTVMVRVMKNVDICKGPFI